jgi:hypothetical protein
MYTEGIAIYDGLNFRQSETDGRYWTELYDDKEFARRDFELMEEQDEIDIDSIEEFKIDKNNYIQTDLGAFKTRKMDIAFLNKINQLIQAVKQLNKELKEK